MTYSTDPILQQVSPPDLSIYTGVYGIKMMQWSTRLAIGGDAQPQQLTALTHKNLIP